ncbi:MAG TPA: glycosyltransferase family 2 protein [Chitinophaga sp.]|uniref:glycosyltransferase family 2 protein n=1 Tax=Chitinophaga sp. TaxID=1869181 RepID=UPI002D093FBB|nr:glycosyltransferase family 2 protein [Chitinophaga sp.]HVI43717.1 glycosyltransferase family 2 protein [Chitinophaga sp.]
MTSHSDTKDISISIIIATFNVAKELRECLQSITAQSFKSIEIVVVDAGSADETVSILKDYKGGHSLVWVSEPDKGIYDALNKGVRLAKGKWLHFLGADDRLLPDFSKLAAELKSENTVYYGISRAYYPAQPRNIGLFAGKFSSYRMSRNCLNHQAILYPAAVFQKYSYDLRYKVCADYALNIRVWGDRQFLKQYFPITIVDYNMDGFSSFNTDNLFKKEKPAIIKESMGWFIYVRFLMRQFRKKLKGQSDY